MISVYRMVHSLDFFNTANIYVCTATAVDEHFMRISGSDIAILREDIAKWTRK